MANTNVGAMLDILKKAAIPGGPSALSVKTYLKPAGGFDRLVAPARYALENKGGSTYVFETRFVQENDAEAPSVRTTVLLDSRESNANRLEEAIAELAENGDSVFAKMPKIKVTYSRDDADDTLELYDYELPHRAYDAHIRTAVFSGSDSPDAKDRYKALRKATIKNAGPLLNESPITILLGGWDSHGGKAKFPSLVVGETYGVLPGEYATTEQAEESIRRRSGARIDPVSASFGEKLTKETVEIITDGTVAKATKPSELGLGSIPPGLKTVDGVAVSQIVRHNVLQFGAVRRLHFGKGVEGDAAIRTLLSAMAIDVMVRANDNLFLRANAQLVVDSEKQSLWVIDDAEVACPALSPQEADELLEIAYDEAVEAGAVDWSEPHVFEVSGYKDLLEAAEDQERE